VNLATLRLGPLGDADVTPPDEMAEPCNQLILL
jgi:hypothetical protein